jgi:hypothetical protein
MVTISESVGLDLEHMSCHELPFARVVYPDDPERILHLAANGAAHVADRMDAYQTPLSALGLIALGAVHGAQPDDASRSATASRH